MKCLLKCLQTSTVVLNHVLASSIKDTKHGIPSQSHIHVLPLFLVSEAGFAHAPPSWHTENQAYTQRCSCRNDVGRMSSTLTSHVHSNSTYCPRHDVMVQLRKPPPHAERFRAVHETLPQKTFSRRPRKLERRWPCSGGHMSTDQKS